MPNGGSAERDRTSPFSNRTINGSYGDIGISLVYWGLTPQQQPGSYQGGEMMMKSVFLVEETGVPGGNHRPTASN